MQLVSRRFRAMFLSDEFDATLWRCAANEALRGTVTTSGAKIDPIQCGKDRWSLKLPEGLLQANTLRAIRACSLHVQAGGQDDAAAPDDAAVNFREALRDVIVVRARMERVLRAMAVRQRRLQRLRTFCYEAPRLSFLYGLIVAVALLSSVSFVLITIRQAIEWSWINAGPGGTPDGGVTRLRVLNHLSFAPLLLACVCLVALTIYGTVRYRHKRSPMLVFFLLVAVAVLCSVGCLMLYINNAVAVWVLPWPVVMAPFFLPFAVILTASTAVLVRSIITSIRYRKFDESVYYGLLWVLLGGSPATLCVLIAARLQAVDATGFHVAYTFIPTLIFAVSLLVGGGRDVIRGYKSYGRWERKAFAAVAFLLPTSLLVSNILSAIWNSYAICAGAVLPTLVAAYITLTVVRK